ncbi:hypothetical protein [Nocardia sp. NPDC056000]|uniref:hypothetical protein n=1 Tax=Nocardia sp. NPDC056000 TaxID=3345674 RepID=UPI0035DB8E22
MQERIPVTDRKRDHSRTWQLWAGPAPAPLAEAHPHDDILMTGIDVTGSDGHAEGWAWGGPLPTESDPVQGGGSHTEDGRTEFVTLRFLDRLPTVHIETTRRTFTVDARAFPSHFGLKFWAQPMESGEEFVAAYVDPAQRPRLEDPALS